jgi:glycosyltransferase involved in cell wall biosynthesis
MNLSVVIPCFNAAETITNQLEALSSEKYSETWEIIISDNGSTDQTLLIVEQY